MMKAKFTVESLKHVRWGIEAELHAVTRAGPRITSSAWLPPRARRPVRE